MVKNPSAMQESWVRSLGWEGPLEEDMQPTPVFWPADRPWTGEPSPWYCKEQDMTERLSPHMPGKIVEDREDWHAAVHGVTELGTVQ